MKEEKIVELCDFIAYNKNDGIGRENFVSWTYDIMFGLNDHCDMLETEEQLEEVWQRVKNNVEVVQEQCEKVLKKINELENKA